MNETLPLQARRESGRLEETNTPLNE